jgi:outer membrane immunogenic protein
MRIALALALLSLPAAALAGPFEGPHVEAVAGLDSTDAGPGLGARDAFLYGIGGGYDWRFGAVVAGLEAEADGSTAKQTIAGVERRVGRSLYAGARLGIAATTDLLFYAKGGYVNGRFGSDAGDSRTGSGFRVGGGAEYAISQHIFLRAEYRYSDYGRDTRGQHFVGALGWRF